MPNPSSVKVGRTEAGYRVRVDGHGTLRNSPAVHAFTVRTLDDQDGGRVVIDLTTCQYLDSTFLGCLVDLNKRYGTSRPPRFEVAAPPETVRRLFGPTHLDRVLHVLDVEPATLGDEVDLSTEDLPLPELGRHLLECHRRLAEVDGPNQAAFRRIVDRLEAELGARPSASAS